MASRDGLASCEQVFGSRRFTVAALVGIVAMALALRLWGIGFGLPHLYHFDEHYYVNTALNLGAGVLHNPPYAAPFLSNVLFPQYALLFVVQRFLGQVASAGDFEALVRTDISAVYMLGRLTVAGFGVSAVPILYLLGKGVGDRRIGLIAAILLATAFLHVRDSHFSVPDGAAPTLVILSILLSVEAIRENSVKYLAYAAFAVGLAASMKWTCALAAIGPMISACHLAQSERRRAAALHRGLLILAVAAMVSFAMSSPQIAINPMPYVEEAFGQARAGQHGGFEFWVVDSVSGWLFYAKTAWWGLGPIPSILALIGALGFTWEGVRKKSITHLTVASFPILYLLAMGSTRHYFARYLLPAVPFLCLFAAWLLVRLLDLIRSPGSRRVAMAVALILIVAQPLANSTRYGWLLSQTDTRSLAKEWIELNVPSGTRVAVDWQTHGPPLATASTAHGNEPAYDLFVAGGTGLADHPLSWYREKGYQYLVTSSYISDIPLVFPDLDAERRAFYASLDDHFLLIKEFSPGIDGLSPAFIFDEIYGPAVSLWERERPGPVLRIYKVR